MEFDAALANFFPSLRQDVGLPRRVNQLGYPWLRSRLVSSGRAVGERCSSSSSSVRRSRRGGGWRVGDPPPLLQAVEELVDGPGIQVVPLGDLDDVIGGLRGRFAPLLLQRVVVGEKVCPIADEGCLRFGVCGEGAAGGVGEALYEGHLIVLYDISLVDAKVLHDGREDDDGADEYERDQADEDRDRLRARGRVSVCDPGDCV